MALSNLLSGLFGKSNNKELLEKAQGFISKKWPNLKQSYWIYQIGVWEKRLMYAGELWLDREPASKEFWHRAEPADSFTPQPLINEFAPAIDAVASNFSSIPEIEATPKLKDDEEAMAIADIVNRLIANCIEENALRADYKSDEDKAGDASQQFVLAGSIFSKVYPVSQEAGQRARMTTGKVYSMHCAQCDLYETNLPEAPESCPQCGGPVEVSEEEVPQEEKDEAGNTIMDPYTRKKIVVEIGNPENAFPRPRSKNMGDSPYFIFASRIPVDDIKAKWNLEASPDNQMPDAFATTYQNALFYWYQGYSAQGSEEQECALVVELFIEPGKVKDFPDGVYAIHFNEKVQHVEPWPFIEHPYTKGDYLNMPTQFWGRTIASDLVGMQRELNRYEAIIALHGMVGAAEPIVVDDNAMVSEITGRCDKIIHIKGLGGEPARNLVFRLQHEILDEGIYSKRQQILESMQRVSASVAVWRGEQPGSVTAASAISQLRGQAELQFSKPTQNWNNFWKETIRKIIKNYQRFYAFEQLVEICGEDCMSQIQQFRNADLDKILEYHATSSGLPKTRDERRQEMMVLYDKGALDINDPNVKEKLFELFGETGMMKTFNDDARRARLNMKRLKMMQPATFREGIDDPMVHLGIALETAKQLDFDRWEPQAQKLVFAYIDTVNEAIAKLAQPPPEAEPKPKEAKEVPPAA